MTERIGHGAPRRRTPAARCLFPQLKDSGVLGLTLPLKQRRLSVEHPAPFWNNFRLDTSHGARASQIAEFIACSIRKGLLRPGDLLPTPARLSKLWREVPDETKKCDSIGFLPILHAYQLLEHTGITHKQGNLGYIVRFTTLTGYTSAEAIFDGPLRDAPRGVVGPLLSAFLRKGITSGTLKSGTLMPLARTKARELHWAPNVIGDPYRDLAGERFLEIQGRTARQRVLVTERATWMPTMESRVRNHFDHLVRDGAARGRVVETFRTILDSSHRFDYLRALELTERLTEKQIDPAQLQVDQLRSDLDPSQSGTYEERIYRHFARLIRSSLLPAGTVLMPLRRLAVALNMHQPTVVSAFTRLINEGLIEKVGRGNQQKVLVTGRDIQVSYEHSAARQWLVTMDLAGYSRGPLEEALENVLAH